MDRTSIIAVVLAAAVLIGWEFWYMPKIAQQQAAQRAAQKAAATAAASGAAMPAPPSLQPAKPTPADEKPVEEKITRVKSEAAEYEFTNIGGGIERVVLTKHDVAENQHVVLNEFGSVPIGAISESAGAGTNLAYTVTASSDAITCERNVAGALRVVKKFTLPRAPKKDSAEEYLVHLDITFQNTAPESRRMGDYYVYVGSAAKIHANDRVDYTSFDWQATGFVERNLTWFQPRSFLFIIPRSPERFDFTEPVKNGIWASVNSQYFTTILTATDEKNEPDARSIGVWARKFPLPKEPGLFGIEGALAMPGFDLKPSETRTEHFQIYAGPKEYKRLKALGAGQTAIMKFGMFKPVSLFLLKMMNTLKSWLGSYAAAIIVMTFIIRGAMWPLQNKSTQSMKRMQALAPKQNEIREKYKDDPTRMNQEIMKLYREYGVNPLAGCLPMLIQIPIFFGFFSMLGTAIELRGSHFLWVKDLSQPDTVAHLGGIPINILPLCMAATMLVQMQLTPKSGDSTQQRMLLFMPLIFVWFCYNFASALALYYTVQNLFSIVQLYLTKNQPVPALQKTSSPPRERKRAKR